jgi:hypothetical protein
LIGVGVVIRFQCSNIRVMSFVQNTKLTITINPLEKIAPHTWKHSGNATAAVQLTEVWPVCKNDYIPWLAIARDLKFSELVDNIIAYMVENRSSWYRQYCVRYSRLKRFLTVSDQLPQRRATHGCGNSHISLQSRDFDLPQEAFFVGNIPTKLLVF